LTDLVDTVVIDLYECALRELGGGLESHVALVPLGGYGRRDMAPFSDVDLMFLYARDAEWTVAPLVKRLNQDIVDSGLSLGSALRTPEFACSAAVKDPTIFTSLCEARFLGGNEALYQRFLSIFRRKAQRRKASLIAQIEKARQEERRQYGETVYLLQPNVKRSRGGLRDLQLLRWVGFASFGESDPENLMLAGALSREDRQQLLAAQEFLLRLRNELHFHAGKPQDLLTKPEQLRLAELYGYAGDETMLPVERFMRDYIQHTNEVRYIVAHFVNSAKSRHRFWSMFSIFSHRAENCFRVTRTGIGVTRRGMNKVCGDLVQVLQLMDLANRHQVRIEHATWQAIRSSMSGRGDMEVSPEVASRFLSLISQPGPLGSLLRRLHELRVLEKIIPPMGHARSLVQFNEYHKYTVDEHSFRAVEFATDLMKDETPLGDAYRSIKDKRVLHLALLMHDLGKGYVGDHSIIGKELATQTARQLGLKSSEADKLGYLVEKHLMMSHLAQRRNIHDEDVVVQFSVDVHSLEMLQMLYVLTCADLAAVGPGVLNDWKLDLLTQLYLSARQYLAGDGVAGGVDERLAKRRTEIHSLVRGEADGNWWETQISGLPRSYLFGAPSERIVSELRQLRELPHDDAVAWGRWLPDRNAIEYTIGAYEEITPGIFHKLTGALTSKRARILSAEIHTLADNLVLDRFFVHDLNCAGEPPKSRLQEVTSALVAALKDKSGKPPTFGRIWQSVESNSNAVVKLPTRVHIDNNSSDRFTIIDIFAHDRLGLLYAISRAIFELGLSVQLAKIGTYLDQVVDVFYVTESSGGKVRDDERLALIRTALAAAIDRRESS
jgi:[protein-PII] uridylyltransferase